MQNEKCTFDSYDPDINTHGGQGEHKFWYLILFLSTEFDNEGRRFVGAGLIDVALDACQQFLSVLEHCDIDVTIETPPAVEEQQWAEFLRDYYMVVQWVSFLTASWVC